MVDSRILVLGEQALVIGFVCLLRSAGAWLLVHWQPGEGCRGELGPTVQGHPSQDYEVGRVGGGVPRASKEALLGGAGAASAGVSLVGTLFLGGRPEWVRDVVYPRDWLRVFIHSRGQGGIRRAVGLLN